MRPAFWGVDRDLKEVLDTIDNVWQGVGTTLATEFKETDQAYFMSIDLPGVNKSNLDIQVEGENIVINAIRKNAMGEGKENEKKSTHTVLIPKHVDKDKIQAHCEDGVLYLAMPKLEKARPKKIEINQGSGKTSWKNILGDSLFGKKESSSQIVE